MTRTAVITVDIARDYRLAGLDLPTDTAAYAQAVDIDDDRTCERIEAIETDMLATALGQFTAGAKAEARYLGMRIVVALDGGIVDLAARGDTLGDDDTADELRQMVWQAGQNAITARSDGHGGWTA